MNLLLGVPVYKRAELVNRCLGSLVDEDADILVIDNGADFGVKQTIETFLGDISVIKNEENQFCNPAWNQVLAFGLEAGYDFIGIGSSDMTLSRGWGKEVVTWMSEHPMDVLLPAFTPIYRRFEVLPTLPPGICTFMTKAAVELIFPIPEKLKLWFGDEWMYTILKSHGYHLVSIDSVRGTHPEQSAILSTEPRSFQIIEDDKLAWQQLESTLRERML